jgi:hypothetical protein
MWVVEEEVISQTSGCVNATRTQYLMLLVFIPSGERFYPKRLPEQSFVLTE